MHNPMFLRYQQGHYTLGGSEVYNFEHGFSILTDGAWLDSAAAIKKFMDLSPKPMQAWLRLEDDLKRTVQIGEVKLAFNPSNHGQCEVNGVRYVLAHHLCPGEGSAANALANALYLLDTYGLQETTFWKTRLPSYFHDCIEQVTKSPNWMKVGCPNTGWFEYNILS